MLTMHASPPALVAPSQRSMLSLCSWNVPPTPPLLCPLLSRVKLAPTRNTFPNDPRTHLTITSRFITTPSPSSNPVISRTRDHGNLSHDLSHDLLVPNMSCDLTAHDPGNITHDQPRNWSSSMSQDHIRFGRATRPLINTWKTVGRIHKYVTVDQSTKARLIGVTPQ